MDSSQHLMAAALEHAEHKFSAAMTQLDTVARLNLAAVDAVLTLDQSDPEESLMTVEAIARAVSQVGLLMAPLVLLDSAMSLIAAGSGDLLLQD